MKERSASKKREKAKFELLRNGNFLFRNKCSLELEYGVAQTNQSTSAR